MNFQDTQIAELNSSVKVKLAASKIHGVGVFALTDIHKGEKLYCFPNFVKNGIKWYSVPYGSLNKLFPEIKDLILERWPSIINGSHFLSPNDMCWLVTFINHSDAPNYDVATDSAIVDIQKGEEITENYRRMDNYAKIYPFLANMI